MKENVQKFMELAKTDEAFQKELEEAAKNYTGEKTEEEIFDSVMVPLMKEKGLSFTLEEYKQSVQELDMDEMSQVSGGGLGVGAVSCDGLGFGLGSATGSEAGAGCLLVGVGNGGVLCQILGIVQEYY